ncbi:MAG TPA: hypothetical protein VL463_26160 [Kofleriaceae bacterium]|nr:hypothetical protein [Kofleriaceae bacterium]
MLAHLACDMLDTAVRCAIVIDRDREAVWTRAMGGRITLSSRSDFLSTEPIAREIAPSLDDDRWGTDGDFTGFLACGTITIRAQLDGADGVPIWRATKTIHGACDVPRIRAHADCDHAIIADAGSGDYYAAEPRPVIICTITIDHGPTDLPLQAYALGNGAPQGGRGLEIELSDRAPVARMRFALTTDGGAIVWRGRARVR